jgi:hypothetical protein
MLIRSEVFRSRPEFVGEVFRLLKESRDAAVRAGNKRAARQQECRRASVRRGADPAFARHDHRSRSRTALIPRRFRVDELFDETRGALA